MAQEKPQAATYPTEIADSISPRYRDDATIHYNPKNSFRYSVDAGLMHLHMLEDYEVFTSYSNGKIDIARGL